MKKYKIFGGYQCSKEKDDLALTPYLALVYVNESYKAYGLSISWGYYTIFIALGINLPKQVKRFKEYKL